MKSGLSVFTSKSVTHQLNAVLEQMKDIKISEE